MLVFTNHEETFTYTLIYLLCFDYLIMTNHPLSVWSYFGHLHFSLNWQQLQDTKPERNESAKSTTFFNLRD